MGGHSPPISHRVGEAIAVGVGGAVLAGGVGWLLELVTPLAVVGGVNGLISGWRGIYRWRSVTGWLAFLSDSTWALATTLGALVAHVVAVVRRRPGYLAELSRRCDRHVYGRGLTTRKGFLLTAGNVVNGAGTGTPATRRIVDEHEHVHVWQARWFGPLFPLLYGAWMLAGATVAVTFWLVHARRRHRFGETVDAIAYYRNPFEWWAYSREGRWPPPRSVRSLVWRRPMPGAMSSTRTLVGSGSSREQAS